MSRARVSPLSLSPPPDTRPSRRSLSLPPVSIPSSLHERPELQFDLPATSKRIRAALKELGIPFVHPVAVSGIVATIKSTNPALRASSPSAPSSSPPPSPPPRPVFALRADMDALPITEEVAVPFASKNKGAMHACGHDGHVSMLLGAAKILTAHAAALPGDVRLIFQPAEEGGAGGKVMADGGVLDGCAGVAGLHVWPDLPSGVVGSRAGTLMAAAGRFEIGVRGRGGHGAMPHLTADPVVAGSAIVAALQPLVSRETPPTRGAVVTVARFNTGPGASNVIPDGAVLAGTLRALTSAEFERLRRRIGEVVPAVARAHGCEAGVEWEAQPYAPTHNDGRLVALLEGVAGGLIGAGSPALPSVTAYTDLPEPTMAAEDFGFLAQAAPGVFAFLGTRNASAGATAGLHTPRFALDEGVLPLGAALHASLAFAGLEEAAAVVKGVGVGAGGRDEL